MMNQTFDENQEDKKRKPNNIDWKTDKKITVVGVGASAGGIKSLREFFTDMPNDIGLAFVVIMHLDPTHKSQLASILGNISKLQTQEAKDLVKIEPNNIYVIPPNTNIEINDKEIHVQEARAQKHLSHTIDHFFRSLAKVKKEKAVGILMSGTGADGTLGLRHIKGEGGLTIVESPESADYKEMPLNAINNLEVDHILEPAEMAAKLITFLDISSNLSDLKKANKNNEKIINEILRMLKNKSGYEFTIYKSTTVNRRIQRRMIINQIKDLENYLNFLTEDEEELSQLYKDLLIGVTNFFRDKEVFEYLKNEIIPDIFKTKKSNDSFRVWIPACSTGEEVYTLAILLEEHLEKNHIDNKIQLFATDIDEDAIKKARKGLYPKNIEGDVPNEYLQKYFVLNNNHYKINKKTREKTIFAIQNPLSDPPFSKIDLVSCRNLLIYLKRNIQNKLIKTFHFSLVNNGYLLLGNAESLGKANNLFDITHSSYRIYRKKPYVSNDKNYYQSFFFNHSGFMTHSETERKKTDLSVIMKDFLFSHYTPPAVIINKNRDVLYIHGNCNPFLEIPAGETTANVIEMAKEDIKVSLNLAVGKAILKNDEVKIQNVHIKDSENNSLKFNIIVSKIDSDTLRLLYMVVFEKVKKISNIPEIEKDVSSSEILQNKRINQLEKELKTTKEDLQITIEELETTNEELKSTNEELQSSNEELRSTNEEIQTSQEELRSVNEELMHVNRKLEHKIDELNRLNSDLKNLMESTEIATLFVDNERNIKRFTPSITELLNIISSDIHRSISHISFNLKYEHLDEDIDKVLKTLIPIEKEIESKDKRWYKMNIRPYRTIDNVIEGAVISFFDITSQKEMENRYKDAYEKSEFYKNILVHDMRNIFQIILSTTEFLKNNETENQEKMIQNLKLAIKKGIQLIKNIERYTRLDKDLPEVEPINAMKELNKSIDNINDGNRQKNINIMVDQQADKAEVLASELLPEIFDNLLINSILYNSGETKNIWINIREDKRDDENYIRFEFIDNGDGIKEKNIFSGIKSEKNPKSKGMGIGLKLVKKLVEIYNGQIWVENRVPGDYTKGSKFILLLHKYEVAVL